MAVNTEQIRMLREKTGAGIVDCQKALNETSGNIDKAVDYLRKKGLASVAKKTARVTAEGTVTSYIHAGGKIGVLLEVNCETDFVAKTDEFQAYVKDIALHVAASNPKYIRREEVKADELKTESEIYRSQAKETKKPDHVIDKIVKGKLEKFYADVCLLEQPFVKDTDKSVQDTLSELITKIGENITIRRFTRFQLGEGIEKKNETFQEGIAKALSS